MTPSQRMRANRDTICAYRDTPSQRMLFVYSQARAGVVADRTHAEDAAQVQELIDHGKCQEANEKSFCLGMLVGGAVALAVLVLTLRLTGVI